MPGSRGYTAKEMPSLPAGTAAVRGAVTTLLQHQLAAGELEPGDLILVACSGGADSLALAAAAAFVAPRLGLRAGAVSVDHAMQPGSEQVAASAAGTCSSLGLDPALVLDAGAPGAGQGPEGAARATRYAALERAAAEHDARAVLLGHTADDQAETVLLALARGSGTRALAGMTPVRGPYLRPLLAVRRAQTQAACAEAGLSPWQDPSNEPDGPWRTAAGHALPRAAVRSRVLPALAKALGPGVVESLVRTADHARADADLLEQLADSLYQRATGAADSTQPAAVVVDLDALADQPAALRTRVLHRAILDAGSPPGSVLRSHVLAADALVTDWHGQGEVHLPGGVRVRRWCGNLVLGTAVTDQE